MTTTRSQTSGVATGAADKELPSRNRSGNLSKKRKAPAAQIISAKKQKIAVTDKTSVKDDAEVEGTDRSTILINRAPVLELWASSVAKLLHPTLSWFTCLSIGGAISTITAISKGRSIGTIQKPDPDKVADKKRKVERNEAKADDIVVMGFNLHLDEDGQAMVGAKPKKSNEDALKKKYGSQNFEHAKRAFEDALQTWKGKEDDLDRRAFHMYEDFRPTVAAGQKGWGRKGVLNLETVMKVVCCT